MELNSVLTNRNSNPANQCGLWVGAVTGTWRSSSVHPDNSKNAYDFNGRNGDIDNDNRDNANNNSVRCVVSRR
jgi:hypothetical protein